MAIILHQLVSTKAYLDDIRSIFRNKIRLSGGAYSGSHPDVVEVDQIAADIIDVSSSDLENWIDDDSSLGNLSDVAIYVALKMILSRYSDVSWNYNQGSAFNYLIPVNQIAQEVANNHGDYDKMEQVMQNSQDHLISDFNPYQILGYSPYAIFDSICSVLSPKFALNSSNSSLKDLVALALVTDYSASYAGLDDDGHPCYSMSIYPSRINTFIHPVAMATLVEYIYINGLDKLNNDQGVTIALQGFDEVHPLMCAFASFLVRTKIANVDNVVDSTLRADWQVHRIIDFYSRFPSSIDRLIKSVSYADMIAVLSGRQMDATDEGNDLDPYASAHNLANIWSAYLNLCKNTDHQLWIRYDCGSAEPFLYSPMIGNNSHDYGFYNATSLPYLLPEISVSSFKSLRDNRVNDRLLNLISSSLKIASELSTSGINVCDCDGEWWPSSSSYYEKTPSVIYLGKNTTFHAGVSASMTKEKNKTRVKSLTIFDKRTYFAYSVSSDSVKIVKKTNSSQRLMSVFLGLADNYKSGRSATSTSVDNAVEANSKASMFDAPSKRWQESLINANVELLARQLLRSIDSSTRIKIDPTDEFNKTTSYWYDKIIDFIASENGFEDCDWINANLGPSITGNHLISLNHHALTTGCLGGGLK